MLIRENGAKSVDPAIGENVGWNNAAFYWPVLLTQKHINPVMFALDQNKNGKAAVVDESDILEGINPEEVLKLSYSGNLEDNFGEEGTVHHGDCFETRALKQTTASLYIERERNRDWKINPNVNLDGEHYHGLYSLNNGVFPFVYRPYKYLLMRNGRDAKADVMLMELDEPTKWIAQTYININEKGNLMDRDSDTVLANVRDTILDINMKERKFEDSTYCQWILEYSIKKILKLRKNRVDWNAIFKESDENE
jgi:hypothetical protein